MNVVVIGNGKFGNALASLLDVNGVEYEIVSRSQQYNKKIDVAFLTIPTQALRSVLSDNLSNISNETILVNCSKGIEEDSHLLPHQIIESIGEYSHYLTLIGPSFAEEIVKQNPTVVSLGYKNGSAVSVVTKLLQTSYFDIVPSSDFKCLELAGAFKNVYAILCGYAHGLGLGSNTQVKLILSALKEFTALSKVLKYPIESIEMPGVIGDLILTCTSTQSRNHTYGMRLAQQDTTLAPHNETMTVEGYHTCHSINALARQYNITLPLALLTADIVSGTYINLKDFRNILSDVN